MREEFRSGAASRLAAAALAALLSEHKDKLLEKWARRVLADPRLPSAVPLSRLALYDHFPEIVDRIITTLHTLADHPEELGKIVGEATEAQEHVRDRVEAAYSVPEVLRELSHLRLSILDVCEEMHEIPDGSSAAILHSAFDQMMINAADELSRLELVARKKAEALALEREALYERERAARYASEDAHRAKDQFLAMVSHELRTPLNAISGWSQMLKTHDGDASMRARAVASIQRNAHAQAQLIDSVLDISRFASGRVTLDMVPVDLATLLRSTVESFNPALTAKKLIVSVSVPDSPTPMLGDELRLRQILTNVLGNAIKFTPQGGRVNVALTSENDVLTIAVADSGIGIPSEFLPHVFEAFQQADSTWTREHGGLGLGMAIAKALVELHGGTIEAESAGRGHGTTFRVRLPAGAEIARPSERASAPSMRPSGDALSAIRVLVVDDADDARELASAILADEGAEVRTATSARDALGILAEGFRPHVLVTDLAMPGEDGISLVHRARAQHGALPAVALSAFTSASDVRRVTDAGFQRYVTKPVVVNDLVSAVAELARPSTNASRSNVRLTETPLLVEPTAESPVFSPSVLIVEDDESIALGLAALLRAEGFSVRTATNGTQAWSVLEQGLHPSIILLDLMMPVMDGWSFRRKLLATAPFDQIPVVVLTGAVVQDATEMTRLHHVVNKPFELDSLLALIKRRATPPAKTRDVTTP